jgi:hypothetical protein
MATTVFPAASAASAPSTIANTVTASAANTLYVGTVSLSVGVYTITCISSTIAAISFFDANDAYIGQTKTASGTVSYNLGTAASKIRYSTDTGSNIIISIQLTGNSVSASGASGTLDTITTTGTYNQTGRMYVVAIGAGGGGASGRGPGTASVGGGGGGAGTISEQWVITNSATTITIGALGNGGGPSLTNNSGGFAGNSGGTTNFGNLISATGGSGGTVAATPISQAGADGTSYYLYSNFIINQGQIGSGGAGAGGNFGGAGGGSASSIGKGGNGASPNEVNGRSATGYGSGGGGASNQQNGLSSTGGAGTSGIVYVLRGSS